MPTPPGTSLGLSPGHALPAVVRVPPSKSLAQRALMAASLTFGRTHLLGIARQHACEDVRAALGVCGTLGAELRWAGPRALAVTGHAPGHHGGLRPTGPLEVGESGTLARLVTAIAGLTCTGEVTVQVAGSLKVRSSPALFESLLRAGVRLTRPAGVPRDGWPVKLAGIGPPSDLLLSRPSSSQEVSALLLACAAYPDPLQVHVEGAIPSRPYVDLTSDLLAKFGVEVATIEPRHVGGSSFCVSGVLAPPATPLKIEPDASAAAVALAAGAIAGVEIRVEGDFSHSHQGDLEMVRRLSAFGVAAGRDESGLWTRGVVTTGADLDLGPAPDLAPPLVAVAAAAALECGATSHFSGLGTLPYKECDRLAVLAGGLRQLGLEVTTDAVRGHLEVGPGPQSGARELLLDPAGDHRMAFAFALFGLVRPGVRVATPEVVAKSWPSFWADLGVAGLSSAP